MDTPPSVIEPWQALPWEPWASTATTLHMWTQIVGKTRLALTPVENHWWNVPLYVTARGLSTSAMPVAGELFEVEFDFVHHFLHARSSTGDSRSLELRAQSVAAFYAEYLDLLQSMRITVTINPKPVEVSNPIPFAEDFAHASYDREAVHRFWRVLQHCDTVFHKFRANFLGKSSPVHFFWGSFDLAVTRFSGKRAPTRAGADAVTREAYSHEVISAGFWPGNGGFGAPAFYCYAAPEPEGLAGRRVRPGAARYDKDLKEFLLLYEDVRKADAPAEVVLDFLQSCYVAAAELGGWDRGALERS